MCSSPPGILADRYSGGTWPRPFIRSATPMVSSWAMNALVMLTAFLIVLALAIGLGIVASLGPTRQAIGVDPVEVLREA